MQYFGIPTCPYCKKHVNLVRTWRLKREGEYKCPRCGGVVSEAKSGYFCEGLDCKFGLWRDNKFLAAKRSGGISNIYLSPLVYVFAVLAICAGVCIYFFHKFVLDDIELFTCLQIFIPFAIFFFLSLFTVYLKRPVIRRVQREAPRQAPQRNAEPERRAPSRDDTFTEMNTGRYRENNEPEHRVNRRV